MVAKLHSQAHGAYTGQSWGLSTLSNPNNPHGIVVKGYKITGSLMLRATTAAQCSANMDTAIPAANFVHQAAGGTDHEAIFLVTLPDGLASTRHTVCSCYFENDGDCTGAAQFKTAVGRLHITKKFDTGLRLAYSPNSQDQLLRAFGSGLDQHSRVAVIDGKGTCGLSPPAKKLPPVVRSVECDPNLESLPEVAIPAEYQGGCACINTVAQTAGKC